MPDTILLLMKIALVHDYLIEAGGAERVLRVLSEMYPEAPIYTAFVRRESRAGKMFSDRRVIESRWGKLLKIGKMYSYLRFLQPMVWKSLDLSEYDLVITSCSGYIARGFWVGKKTRVVAYCHTPPKWLYGYETPTRARGKWWGKIYLWVWGPFVRYFDYTAAQRVDTWMANSQEVARRIKKFYGKNSIVVYPPIELSKSSNSVSQYRSEEKRENWKTGKLNNSYYLVVGRLVGAKGVEMAVEACKKMGCKLVVVGEGATPQAAHVGGQVEYTGWVSDEKLAELYAGARGYLALAVDEDFGMTVVESILSGTPVVALASGGYKETVIDPAYQHISVSVNQKKQKVQTGILVKDFTVSAVVRGMKELEKKKWDREKMQKLSKKYGRARFEKEVSKLCSPGNTQKMPLD